MTTKPMDPETRAALEASIQHWRENAAAERPEDASVGADSCALCKIFVLATDSWCEGCPVMLHTGMNECGGTPYRKAFAALNDWRKHGDEDYRDAFHAAAREEVAFLESLRPQEDFAVKRKLKHAPYDNLQRLAASDSRTYREMAITKLVDMAEIVALRDDLAKSDHQRRYSTGRGVWLAAEWAKVNAHHIRRCMRGEKRLRPASVALIVERLKELLPEGGS